MSLEDVPENMTAVQVVNYSQPHELRTVPTPRALQPHDLLVKVAVASLCHTDFMVASGVFKTALPCTASHEGSGTVAGLGSAVTSFAAGDRVMCGLYRDFCGACADCLGPENYRQYCQHSRGAIGVNVDGAFADYVVVDSRSAARLPDAVSFETAAPLACAGCTVWRSILQADLVKGEWIALVGSGGGLGHLGVQFAKALGLNVVGVDARDEALELTKEAGADVVVDARKGKEHVVAEVQRVTAGKGADATVTISDAESAAALACAVTKMHGVMVQVAQVWAGEGFSLYLSFFPLAFVESSSSGEVSG